MGLISRCLLELLVCTITPLTPTGSDTQFYAVCPIADYEVAQTQQPWYNGYFEGTRMVIKEDEDITGRTITHLFVLKCPKGES